MAVGIVTALMDVNDPSCKIWDPVTFHFWLSCTPNTNPNPKLHISARALISYMKGTLAPVFFQSDLPNWSGASEHVCVLIIQLPDGPGTI
jgi:hypothetical protein